MTGLLALIFIFSGVTAFFSFIFFSYTLRPTPLLVFLINFPISYWLISITYEKAYGRSIWGNLGVINQSIKSIELDNFKKDALFKTKGINIGSISGAITTAFIGLMFLVFGLINLNLHLIFVAVVFSITGGVFFTLKKSFILNREFKIIENRSLFGYTFKNWAFLSNTFHRLILTTDRENPTKQKLFIDLIGKKDDSILIGHYDSKRKAITESCDLSLFLNLKLFTKLEEVDMYIDNEDDIRRYKAEVS